MKSFSEMREDASEKLDRPLIEKEVVFLEWVYQRYTEEVETTQEKI